MIGKYKNRSNRSHTLALLLLLFHRHVARFSSGDFEKSAKTLGRFFVVVSSYRIIQ